MDDVRSRIELPAKRGRLGRPRHFCRPSDHAGGKVRCSSPQFGLAAFIAMTGLQAGPIFLSSLAEAGLRILLGGMVVTTTPMVVGLLFGRHILRMNPILLLGALAGAQTTTAAMAAVQERSGSPTAVLGYTPAYPIGHVLLATWGSVIVGLTAA